MDFNEELRKATLKLAQQGDPKAIATLINQALQSRSVTVNVTRTGDRLKILLEGKQVPDADSLTTYLQTSLTKLRAQGIHMVHLVGRQQESAKLAWNRSFQLPDTMPAPVPSISRPQTPPVTPGARTVPTDVRAMRRKTPRGHLPQTLVGAIAAITLILIGANIRSLMNLATGTPNFVAAATGPDGRYEAPIIDSVYGIPIIHVSFNGQTFPMMVDTGASGTLVTQPMAAALRIRPVGQVESSTANGTARFDVGYVRSIEIDGATVYNVPVAIGQADLDVGLLGHDFFQYFDVVIRQDVVEFHPRAR